MLNQLKLQTVVVWGWLLLAGLMPTAWAQTQPAAPASRAEAACKAGAEQPFAGTPFARTELFFGRNKPDGGKVGKREWESFLNEVVTPRFPQGLTVLSGAGQFLDSHNEIEEERSLVLILIYPLEQRKEKSARIEEIRERYKQLFRQESVLRMDTIQPVWVSF